MRGICGPQGKLLTFNGSTAVEQNIRRYDDMEVPLIFSFWFMVAAYVIHVLDESLLACLIHDS